jgi:hypothetical protein
MSDVEKEIDKLFKAAVTPEQRKTLWADIFETLYEIYDDEEWARFRKQFDEAIAKRSAH